MGEKGHALSLAPSLLRSGQYWCDQAGPRDRAQCSARQR